MGHGDAEDFRDVFGDAFGDGERVVLHEAVAARARLVEAVVVLSHDLARLHDVVQLRVLDDFVALLVREKSVGARRPWRRRIHSG